MRYFLSLAFVGILLTGQAAFPQKYAITDLGILPGGSYSIASGINNNGEVTGWADTSTGAMHAFLFSNGTMHDLGTLPNHTHSAGVAVNASGQVTGWSENAGVAHAFLFSNGTMQDLGTLPGDVASFGRGINDSGQVTGNSVGGPDRAFLFSNGTMYDLHDLETPPGPSLSSGYDINNHGQVTGEQGFLFSNGTILNLGTLGGRTPLPRAINDSGQVTGWADTSNGTYHAFLYSNGTMHDLGTLPGGTFSYGTAINESGQVTGQSDDGSNFVPVLFSNGTIQDLSDLIPPHPGWSLIAGTGINDVGQITVNGTDNGKSRAFLLTPIELALRPTKTTLVSSSPSSMYGQTVRFTIQVTSDSGVPTGTVTLSNGTIALGASTLVNGKAIISIPSLPVGVYIVTATYGANSNFAASTSPALRQVVNATNKSATSTSLVSNLNPSTYGQAVTFMAMVTPSGQNKPTGNIVFRASQNGRIFTVGTAPLDANGLSSLTTSNLNGSYSYSITGVYSGDVFNTSSTSAVVTQVVKQATSAATITSSANPSSLGQAVTFTARITSPTVTVTGPVTFTAGNTVLGTAQLSRGTATFTTSALPTGSTTITVTHLWNSNVDKSSASLVQTVQ